MTNLTTSDKKGWAGLSFQIKKQQVILTASICLIALVIVLKNVLMVPQDVLLRDTVIFIVIYLGFLSFTLRTGDTETTSGNVSPLVGDLLVVLITLAIIAVYAL